MDKENPHNLTPELYQKLQQRVYRDLHEFRRLSKAGRLDVLFNYGLSNSDIRDFLKLDDASIDHIAKNIRLSNTDREYVTTLIATLEKMMQAAQQGASRDTIEIIRSKYLPPFTEFNS